MRQITRAAELEKASALLRVELDAARSKLVEVEHRKWTLTYENEGLKRDLEGACAARDVMVRDKELV